MNATVRRYAVCGYLDTWARMRRFTADRGPATPDEIWLLQHPRVYTLGLAAGREHLLDPGDIPVVQCDRGGQVTYHGPGQLIAYVLVDLRRLGFGPRELVRCLEQAVIGLLGECGITGRRQAGAPGVYVEGAKIAALGLRVRRGCAYHGLSLNVHMDLDPFAHINPCGYPGLAVTQLYDLGYRGDCAAAGVALEGHLAAALYGGARPAVERAAAAS